MFNFGHHGQNQPDHGQNQPAHPPAASALRLAHPHFLVLCLVVGALPYAEQLVIAAGELHLHPAMVARIVLAVAGLFDWAVLSLNFLVARWQAEEEPKPQARPAATTAAPTASASRLAHPHFIVLCLVVCALPYAGQLVTATGKLHLHPAMVACIVLAVAGLFDWAVLSLNFLVVRRQAEEPKPQARPAATTAAPTASASSLARPHFVVLCLVVGALPYAEQLVTAARELHIHPAMVACIVLALALAGLFDWAVLSLNFLVARLQAEEEPKPQARPAATTAAPTASASRLAHPHFLVLCLAVGALPYAGQLVTAAGELHLHPAMVACIVLAVTGLFDWAVLSLNFLVARRQAEEPKPQARPAATTAAPTASASSLARPHFVVLCLVVGTLPYAEQLVTAARELHIHPAMVACIVLALALAGLFDWAVLSLNFLVARLQAEEEPKPQARPAATTAAPTASASRLAHPHFLVLCLAVGALPYAGQLVTAAGELHLHPAMVACIVLAVAGLFDWAVLSLNFLVARRQAEEPKPQARPAATTAAPTASASRLPLLPFLVLALAMAAAMVAGPAVAAEAIHLPPNAVVWACLALAVSFHVAIGSIYCFVVNRPPPAVAGAEPQSRSDAPGSIVASLASAAAIGVTSDLLVAGGAASGDRSARI